MDGANAHRPLEYPDVHIFHVNREGEEDQAAEKPPPQDGRNCVERRRHRGREGGTLALKSRERERAKRERKSEGETEQTRNLSSRNPSNQWRAPHRHSQVETSFSERKGEAEIPLNPRMLFSLYFISPSLSRVPTQHFTCSQSKQEMRFRRRRWSRRRSEAEDPADRKST